MKGSANFSMSLSHLKFLAVLIMATVAVAKISAQSKLFGESFENTTVQYTTSIPEFSDGNEDFFLRTDGTTDVASNYDVNGKQGTYFFGADDIDGEGAALPVFLNLKPINIAGYTNLEFRVYFAEDDDGSNEDWDAADFVHVNCNIDGGPSQNLLWIESEFNSGSNDRPFLDVDFDGVGDVNPPSNEITDTFQQFSAAITGTGNTLNIVIEFDLNSGDEDISIDSIEVFGTNMVVPNSRIYVNDTGSAGDVYTTAPGNDSNNGTAAFPYATIQHAIDQANAGDTIFVDAGDFHGQLEINKDIHLFGSGATTTKIRATDTMSLFFPSQSATFPEISPGDNFPVVFVHDADVVEIKDLTINGMAKGNFYQRLIGIAYVNAGGRIRDVVVKGIANTPFNGNGFGIGILGITWPGPEKFLLVQNCQVYGFQEFGMSFRLNSTPTVTMSQITGTSGSGSTAMYLFRTSGGMIIGNRVDTVGYGVYLYRCTDTALVKGNIMNHNDIAVYSWDNHLEAIQNEIGGSGTGGIMAFGDVGLQYAKAMNNYIEGMDFGISGFSQASGVLTMDIHENHITDADSAAVWGGGTSTTISASCNWYGVTSASDVAQKVEGTEDYIPWLMDGTDNMPGMTMAALGFQPLLGACTGEPQLPGDSIIIVSDSSWRKSTVVTLATADQYPWHGVSDLPDEATFNLPVETGQPYGWHSIYSVNGAGVIKTGNAISYFRKTFILTSDTAIWAQFRAYMDDGMEIYINGHLLAREGDRSPSNYEGAAHNILFNPDGTIENAYMGGDGFDFVNNYRLDSMITIGENTIVVAIRNASKSGGKGGFSFRMDLKTNVPYIPALTGFIASDVEWEKSTVSSSATATAFPWSGAVALPPSASFSLGAEIGQPYGYQSLEVINGSYPIKAKENITYYRRRFSLIDSADLNVRIRATFDDNIEVYLNGVKLVRESDFHGDANFSGPVHDIHFDENGTITNGHMGGDGFDFVAPIDMNTILHTGSNYITVAIRNRPMDKGGFSLRMDIDKAGVPVIEKRTVAPPEVGINAEILALDFEIYPNPATGIVTLHILNEILEKDNEVLIYDVSGRMLFKDELSALLREGGLKIDLSPYPNGLYFVRLRSGEEYLAKRVVKSR